MPHDHERLIERLNIPLEMLCAACSMNKLLWSKYRRPLEKGVRIRFRTELKFLFRVLGQGDSCRETNPKTSPC